MTSPGSPPLPHSTTWSILKALGHLSPPPSDIDIAALSALPSSGDIPLLIHHGIQLPQSSTLGPVLVDPPDTRGADNVQSSYSCGTVGTFGPLYSGNRRYSAAASDVQDSGTGGFVPGCASTPPKDARDAKRISADEYHISIQDSPVLPRPARMCSIGPDYAQEMELQYTLAPPATTYDDPEPLSPVEPVLMTPSPSLSTLPTPVFAPGSPALSITPESSPDRRFARRLRTVMQKGVSYVASRHSPTSGPGSPASLNKGSDSTPCIPGAKDKDKDRDSSPSIGIRRRPRSGSSSTTKSDYTPLYPRAIPVPFVPASSPAQGPKISDSDTSGPLSASSLDLLKFGLLPVSMAWLKETTVTLSIDQEGFRNVRPDFKLVGYTGPPDPRASPTLAAHLSLGRADFIPTHRQAFTFHHAPLDTPPVLRRLTVNGDESHDYMARQALLSVKSPGAYSVRGAETCHLNLSGAHSHSNGNSSAGELVSLSWQFDYLVGDRPGHNGGGEKTLTPLRFMCSPGLVHPLHGKKVRLMQVFRKSVVPKLAAEKIAPPLPPWSAAEVTQTQTQGRAKAFLVGHRRAKSQAQALALKQAEVNVPRDARGHPGGHGHVKHARSLYASNSFHANMLRAGNSNGAAQGAAMPEFKHVRDDVQQMGMAFQDHTHAFQYPKERTPPHPPLHHASASPQKSGTPGRYILPREVLASMFAEPLDPPATPASRSGNIGMHMMPLSPPKYHVHPRRGSLSGA